MDYGQSTTDAVKCRRSTTGRVTQSSIASADVLYLLSIGPPCDPMVILQGSP
uniref:Uncharacterized protein n=1 Tax=Anguilla anguilla TaxID=7936 RepID=A0A0E9XFG9_ANGAN